MAAAAPMNPLREALRLAAAELGPAGHGWALVGGLAISARLEPRFTRDLDLAVSVADDRAAEALIQHFRRQGYEILALVEQEVTGRLATIRLGSPAGRRGVIVDLLFASTGIEPEIVEAAEPLEIAAGLRVPVARLGHLLAMKILSRDDERRPQDLIDIRNLLAAATEDDLAQAREALELITRRGCHRNKDLLAELGALWSS
jgi:hypothetical protein